MFSVRFNPFQTSNEEDLTLVRHTKPGGLVEFQDYDLQYYSRDGSLKSDSSMAKWINLILEAARKAERDPCPGPSLESWVRDAGFTEIHHEKMQLPIGTWPKDKKLVSSSAIAAEP